MDDEDVDSVGGLLGKAIGRVPLPGAQGDLLGVHMEAEGARGRRRQVGTVLCSRSPEPGASGPGGSGGDGGHDGDMTPGDRYPTTSDHAPGQE